MTKLIESIKKIIRIAIYIRVSDVSQLAGSSMDIQERELIDFCKKQGNYKIVEIFREEGFTGHNQNRPQLNKLLNLARQKKIDMVVTCKIDRFARNTRDFLNIEAELKENGVAFISLAENIDTSTPAGRMMMTVTSSFAEFEWGRTRERTLAGQIESKKKNRWSGMTSYGLDIDPNTKKLTINKEEAVWVEKMFQWVAEEKLSQYKVQERLNALGVPTKLDNLREREKEKIKKGEVRKGRRVFKEDKYFWRKRTVSRILNNPIYTGTFTHRKYKDRYNVKTEDDENLRPESEWIESETPQIISLELFEAAQAQMNKNKQFQPRKTKHLFLLQGLVYCKRCGGKCFGHYFKTTNESARIRYKCYKNIKWITDNNCKSGSIAEKKIEPLVWDKISKIITDPTIIIKMIEKEMSSENNVEKKQERIAELKKIKTSNKEKEKKLVDLYLEQAIVKEIYDKKRGDLKRVDLEVDEELDRLKSDISVIHNKSQISKDLKKMFRKYRSNLENITPEEKREIYKMIVKKIYVLGDSDDIEIACNIEVGNNVLSDDRRVGRAL